MAERKKLFGTDGVRGPVGDVLTPELALALGRATAAEIEGERPQVLIIRDTRESGHMLESALAAGLAAAGADVFLGGVLPTPAAAILVRKHGFDLGAVVSASHNPWQDNGIKFFGRDARKLDDEAEARVEARVAAGPATGSASGRIRKLEGALDDYLRALAERFDLDLSGPRDRPRLRQRSHLPRRSGGLRAPRGRSDHDRSRARRPQHQRGLRVDPPRATSPRRSPSTGPRSASPSTATATGCWPSTETVASSTATRSSRSQRCTCARSGELPGGVAVTVMSNYGFHQAMEAAGIEVATTKVGDRFVIEELIERGWTIGGEQSGHIIWTDFAATGDGLAAALLVMRALGAASALGEPADREAPAAARERPGPQPRGARRGDRRSGRRSAARAPSSRAGAGFWSGRREPSRSSA